MNVYADLNFNKGVIAPWTLGIYKRKAYSSKRIRTENEAIVIDSDDENDVNSKNYIDVDEDIDYFVIMSIDRSKVLGNFPHIAIATTNISAETQILPRRRVIAQRMSKFMPYIQISEHEKAFIYENDEAGFYAGIVSNNFYCDNNEHYFMIFFDDGHVQYVPNKKIRLVYGDSDPNCIHINARSFYDYYFNALKYSHRVIEVLCIVNKKLKVYLNDKFEVAKVLECDYDKKLAKIMFIQSKRIEWIYTGSPRFEIVWHNIVKDKYLQRYNDKSSKIIEISSDSDEEFDANDQLQNEIHTKSYIYSHEIKQMDRKIQSNQFIKNVPATMPHQHHCSTKCVQKFETNDDIFKFDPLKRPMFAGWTRVHNYYQSPCGRRFKTFVSMKNLQQYLIKTKSKLSIDCFSFEPIRYMFERISYNESETQMFINHMKGGSKEKILIPVISINDNFPKFKEYIIEYHINPKSKKLSAKGFKETISKFRSNCDCLDDCSDKSKCSCWQLTLEGAPSTAGYKYKRLNNKVDTGIYECNANCKCSAYCLNRVVKPYVEQPLELFETRECGFGIRCRTDLPKGTFIACYFGDLLHGKTADERGMKKNGEFDGDAYFMQLDHIETAITYKDGYESDIDDIDIDDEMSIEKRPRFDDSFKEKTLNNNIIPYIPSITKHNQNIEENQRTLLYGKDAVEYVVDGRYRGNISRFFNHSCDPNLFSQTVFVDTHDLRFPWLAFFAAQNISAGTELTWDYNYQVGSIQGRHIICKCGRDLTLASY